MRKLLLVASFLLILCSASVLAARSIAPAPTANGAALLDPAGCVSPVCWHGISPWRSTVAQFNAIMRDAAEPIQPASLANLFYRLCHRQQCWEVHADTYGRAEDDLIGRVALTVPTGALTLGDLVARYGQPTTSQLCVIIGSINGNLPSIVPRPAMAAYFTFKGGLRVVAYNLHQPMSRRYDLRMEIFQIYFENAPDITVPSRQWKGFTSVIRDGCNRG